MEYEHPRFDSCIFWHSNTEQCKNTFWNLFCSSPIEMLIQGRGRLLSASLIHQPVTKERQMGCARAEFPVGYRAQILSCCMAVVMQFQLGGDPNSFLSITVSINSVGCVSVREPGIERNCHSSAPQKGKGRKGS